MAFNGSAFYCKDAPAETEEAEALTIPNCGPGEVLTGSGGNLVCVAGGGTDTTPDPFGPLAQESGCGQQGRGGPWPAHATSYAIRIVDFDGSLPVTVRLNPSSYIGSADGQGGEYTSTDPNPIPEISINGGPWVTSGTITADQTLQVRGKCVARGQTLYSITVTVGEIGSFVLLRL